MSTPASASCSCSISAWLSLPKRQMNRTAAVSSAVLCSVLCCAMGCVMGCVRMVPLWTESRAAATAWLAPCTNKKQASFAVLIGNAADVYQLCHVTCNLPEQSSAVHVKRRLRLGWRNRWLLQWQ